MQHARADGVRGMFAALERNLGNARQDLAVVFDVRGITDDEDLGIARNMRSGPTTTRPGRSVSTPDQWPAGEAATPAVHKTVRVWTRSPAITTPSASTSSTAFPSRTSTPSERSLATAPEDSSFENVARARGPVNQDDARSTGINVTVLGRHPSEVLRELAGQLAAVGPAPTSTNVSSCSRSFGSSVRSACSSAPIMRRRRNSASARVFMLGASGAHSSCPK